MTRTTWVKSRAGEMECEVRGIGDGPPVVLLHANAWDRRDYDAVVGPLAQRRRVVAVDWPGCGRSPLPAEPRRATAMQYAAALVDVLDELRIERAALIGNSVGGYAAARLALDRPERVAALVLVNSGGFSAPTPIVRLFCAIRGREWVTRLVAHTMARRQLRRRTPVVAQMLARIRAERNNPALVAIDAAVWRSFSDPEHDLRERARAIVAPTLIAWGARDPVLRLEIEGRAAQAAIPHARLVRFDAGHAPFAEVPEEFLAAVQPFLDEALASDHFVEPPRDRASLQPDEALP